MNGRHPLSTIDRGLISRLYKEFNNDSGKPTAQLKKTRYIQPGMVANAFNHSIWQAEADRYNEFKSGIQHEFQNSLGHTEKPCFKKQQQSYGIY